MLIEYKLRFLETLQNFKESYFTPTGTTKLIFQSNILFYPNWPYISTFQTIIRNVCLSVISEFCLLSVCSVPTIFDFRDPLFGQDKNIDLCLKKYYKNERHLRLITNSFTKLSQNVCLINTHILTCQMQLHVMEGPLILLQFLGIFIH